MAHCAADCSFEVIKSGQNEKSDQAVGRYEAGSPANGGSINQTASAPPTSTTNPNAQYPIRLHAARSGIVWLDFNACQSFNSALHSSRSARNISSSMNSASSSAGSNSINRANTRVSLWLSNVPLVETPADCIQAFATADVSEPELCTKNSSEVNAVSSAAARTAKPRPGSTPNEFKPSGMPNTPRTTKSTPPTVTVRPIMSVEPKSESADFESMAMPSASSATG